MENATCGKRNFNDVTSLLHGLPEYPIAQIFLEIGLEISTCANSVYQAFLLPLLKRLGMRLLHGYGRTRVGKASCSESIVVQQYMCTGV